MTEFDHIIVGGGTAGCVLANRLTADPGVSVLMLEAGQNVRSFWVDLPLGLGFILGRPQFDWCYESEPEPHLDNRRIRLPRGRMLGGSSGINGMVYVRGHGSDYDRWAQMGNPGWAWADVLPYFRRSERFEGSAQPAHGTDGEWRIRERGHTWPILDAYRDAAIQAGLPANPDYNSGENEGVAYFQSSIAGGIRQSAARAFLQPVLNRPNLTVATGVMVDRLGLEGRRVVSVEWTRGDQRQTARARREIVLCAGAYASPAILERSGIGQANRLRDLGIAPVHDLPGVGENLQDHWQVRIQHRVRGLRTLNDAARGPLRKAALGAHYLLTRRGPLGSQPPLLAVFGRSAPHVVAPDIEVHVSAASYDRVGGPLDAFSGITSSTGNLRPESAGWCHIPDRDHRSQPRILNNFLATEGDREVAVQAVALARRIARQPALAPHIDAEAPVSAAAQTRDEILDLARQILTTVFHPVGTCKMGTDPMAVVDPQLRVHGLAGLRVVDASIMPRLVSGNTAAPTVMIAEKAADLIRDAARSHPDRIAQAVPA